MVPLGSLQAFLRWGSVPYSGQLALLVLELGAAVYHWASARPLCSTVHCSTQLVRALRTSSVHLMRRLRIAQDLPRALTEPQKSQGVW